MTLIRTEGWTRTASGAQANSDAVVVYQSRKGRILGEGSGIKTAEQARQVGAALRGRQKPASR